MKKIIVLGANGMAGHVITNYLRSQAENYHVISVARTAGIVIPDVLLDVTNFEKLKTLIEDEKPDFVINAIGLLNEVAEKNPDLAVLINSYLPHFLESVTRNTACKIIHISTDCVFSGKKGEYIETDFKDGKGYYAQSKALGEIINDKDVTLRTSIIGPEINPNGIGLFNWFMQQEGVIKGYTNAIWTGITTIELAKIICFIIRPENNNITGLYHLVNDKSISKHDLLYLTKSVFQMDNITIEAFDDYKVDKSLINTRNELLYDIPNYLTMLNEMELWVKTNQIFYQYSY